MPGDGLFNEPAASMVTQDLARELPKQQSSMERQLKAGRIVMKTCARCAKAAMMGLVYTHWYGMYGVTHRFYMEFVPQLGELIDHNRSGSKASAATWLGNKLGEVLNSECTAGSLVGQTRENSQLAMLPQQSSKSVTHNDVLEVIESP